MSPSYWHRQDSKPLFPQLEWSRPETRTQAGKLLTIGGTGQGFAAPANAYRYAEKAGIGTQRVLLPDSLVRSVSKLFPAADFAPSNPSGSFAANSLAAWYSAALWADGVLFPGDIGRNSETSILLEQFLSKFQGAATVTRDAADLLCQQPRSILERPETLLVLAPGQLQKLATEAHFPQAFTSSMGLVQLVDQLHSFTTQYAPYIITRWHDQLVVAVQGTISTTPLKHSRTVWRLQAAATASVWWLQNPARPFAALSTGVFTIA